jgi:hypothetical protein
LLPALLILGCATPQKEMMPLTEDSEWTYQSRAGLRSFIASVEVQDQVPVAGGPGWRLVSDFGESHWAWKDGVLVASLLPFAAFDPPLPMLDPTWNSQPEVWEGIVELPSEPVEGSAEILAETTELEINQQDTPATKITHRMDIGREGLLLETWFVDGIGIARQEQRRGERLELMLEYQAGP